MRPPEVRPPHQLLTGQHRMAGGRHTQLPHPTPAVTAAGALLRGQQARLGAQHAQPQREGGGGGEACVQQPPQLQRCVAPAVQGRQEGEERRAVGVQVQSLWGGRTGELWHLHGDV